MQKEKMTLNHLQVSLFPSSCSCIINLRKNVKKFGISVYTKYPDIWKCKIQFLGNTGKFADHSEIVELDS